MAFPIEPILSKLIPGDQKAYARIYSHYQPVSLKFCESLMKDKAEAERMVQDVFRTIWNRRVYLKSDLDFEAWLFVCLRNRVFHFLKTAPKAHLLQQQELRETQRIQPLNS